MRETALQREGEENERKEEEKGWMNGCMDERGRIRSETEGRKKRVRGKERRARLA